jgi:hypothetical protein
MKIEKKKINLLQTKNGLQKPVLPFHIKRSSGFNLVEEDTCCFFAYLVIMHEPSVLSVAVLAD